jgi:5'-deoxynucleotidase YfbR-like HD superfamily hydrolase
MVWRAWRAGTARPSASTPFPSPSTAWWWRRWPRHLSPGLEPRWRLAALLHDAPEYVIGDMISPFKAALGLDYKRFEARLEGAIHLRFGLPPRNPPDIEALIKAADRACAGFEAVQLAGFTPAEAARLFGAPPAGFEVQLEPLGPAAAQARYLARFHLLLGAQAPDERGGRSGEPAGRDAAFETE